MVLGTPGSKLLIVNAQSRDDGTLDQSGIFLCVENGYNLGCIQEEKNPMQELLIDCVLVMRKNYK